MHASCMLNKVTDVAHIGLEGPKTRAQIIRCVNLNEVSEDTVHRVHILRVCRVMT